MPPAQSVWPGGLREQLEPLEHLEVRHKHGQEMRRFKPSFSARLGERFAPGYLWCGFCMLFRVCSSFSSLQCSVARGLRHCLACSTALNGRHLALPSGDACTALWNNGLSMTGKNILAASNGDGEQVRNSSVGSPEP